jgi:hypothetical protein
VGGEVEGADEDLELRLRGALAEDLDLVGELEAAGDLVAGEPHLQRVAPLERDAHAEQLRVLLGELQPQPGRRLLLVHVDLRVALDHEELRVAVRRVFEPLQVLELAPEPGEQQRARERGGDLDVARELLQVVRVVRPVEPAHPLRRAVEPREFPVVAALGDRAGRLVGELRPDAVGREEAPLRVEHDVVALVVAELQVGPGRELERRGGRDVDALGHALARDRAREDLLRGRPRGRLRRGGDRLRLQRRRQRAGERGGAREAAAGEREQGGRGDAASRARTRLVMHARFARSCSETDVDGSHPGPLVRSASAE